ncbi:MAG TPA: TonB-dependent receptor [Methylophilus sp.]|nr:TonB-dependent receptor [Methylophilus sp.]HQQ34194.1 TonB-dependent receptor [Methylophilus sp.]
MLTLSSQPGFAEEVAHTLSEHDYLDDMPRVLTVSRLAQNVTDAPSAVTVIDRATIRESGAVDLPDLFRLVPGMYVGANAGYVYNTNHAVSYHGMTTAYPGNMQVLINGRSVYTPLFGGVKWSELPVALIDIERIEVTRGPNAASYGANAFFATINIITQHPSEISGNSTLLTHGNGRNEAFYRHAGKSGDWVYRATLGYRQDDGWQRRNDFKRTRFLNAQADYQIDLNNSLELEFGATDGERGEGNINEDPIVFLPRTKDISNFHGLARWKSHLSDDSELQLQAYHSYDRSDDATTSVFLPPVLIGLGVPAIVANNLVNNRLYINNDVVSERTDIEAQHTFAVGNNIRVVWGGSVRHDTMYAPFYLSTRKTDRFDLQRLFGHVEWRPHPMWTVNGGAMLEHNDFTGTDVSPRVSLNFKPHPQHAIRAGISSALRTPNYYEEKFNNRYYLPTTLAAPLPQALLLQLTANTGNVDPEQIVSREVGYVGRIGALSLDARVFSDRISDVIRFDTRTDFTVPAGVALLNKNGEVDTGLNSGDAAVEGVELQTDWKLGENTRLLFNYAHVSIRETHPNLKKNFPKSMPSNSFSALITQRFNADWDASLAYYQVGQTTQLGDGDPVDLIRKSDLRIARKFKQGNVGGEMSLVVENLFNDHYLEFADYNEAKRRARLNVKLDF